MEIKSLHIFSNEKNTQALYKKVHTDLINRTEHRSIKSEKTFLKPLDIFEREIICTNENGESTAENALWFFKKLVKSIKSYMNTSDIDMIKLCCLLDNFIDKNKTENESHQLIVVATQAALEMSHLPINQQIKILNHVKEKYPNFKLDKVESLLSDSTESTFTKEELAKLLQFKKKVGAEKFIEIIENYKIDKNDNNTIHMEEPINTTSFTPPPPPPGDCPIYIPPTLNFSIVNNTKTEPQDSTSEKTGGSLSDALNQIKNGAFNLKPSSERVLDEKKEKQVGMGGLMAELKKRQQKNSGNLNPISIEEKIELAKKENEEIENNKQPTSVLEEIRKRGGLSGGSLKKTGLEKLDERLEKEKLEKLKKEKENKTGFLVNALNNRRGALGDNSSEDESESASWDDE